MTSFNLRICQEVIKPVILGVLLYFCLDIEGLDGFLD